MSIKSLKKDEETGRPQRPNRPFESAETELETSAPDLPEAAATTAEDTPTATPAATAEDTPTATPAATAEDTPTATPAATTEAPTAIAPKIAPDLPTSAESASLAKLPEAHPDWEAHAAQHILTPDQQKTQHQVIANLQTDVADSMQRDIKRLAKLSEKDIKNFFTAAPKETWSNYESQAKQRYQMDILETLSEQAHQQSINLPSFTGPLVQTKLSHYFFAHNVDNLNNLTNFENLEIAHKLPQKTEAPGAATASFKSILNVADKVPWYDADVARNLTKLSIKGLQKFIQTNDISALEKVQPLLKIPQINYKTIWQFVNNTLKKQDLSIETRQVLISTLFQSFSKKQKNWRALQNFKQPVAFGLIPHLSFEKWSQLEQNAASETNFLLQDALPELRTEWLKNLELPVELTNVNLSNVFKSLNKFNEKETLDFLIHTKFPFFSTSQWKRDVQGRSHLPHEKNKHDIQQIMSFADSALDVISKNYDALDLATKKTLLNSLYQYGDIAMQLLQHSDHLTAAQKYHILIDNFLKKHWPDEKKREFLIPFIEVMDDDTQKAFFRQTDLGVYKETSQPELEAIPASPETPQFDNFKELFKSPLLKEIFFRVLDSTYDSPFKQILNDNLLANPTVERSTIFKHWYFWDLHTDAVMELPVTRQQQFIDWVDECCNNIQFFSKKTDYSLKISFVLYNYISLYKKDNRLLHSHFQNVKNSFLQFLNKIIDKKPLNPLEVYTDNIDEVTDIGKLFLENLQINSDTVDLVLKPWLTLQKFWQNDISQLNLTNEQWQNLAKNHFLLLKWPKPPAHFFYDSFQREPAKSHQLLKNFLFALEKTLHTPVFDDFVQIFNKTFSQLYPKETVELNHILTFSNEDFFKSLHIFSEMAKRPNFLSAPDILHFFYNAQTASQILKKINDLEPVQASEAVKFYKNIVRQCFLGETYSIKPGDAHLFLNLPWRFEELILTPQEVSKMLLVSRSMLVRAARKKNMIPQINTFLDYFNTILGSPALPTQLSSDMVLTILSSAQIEPSWLRNIEENTLWTTLQNNLFIFQQNPHLLPVIRTQLNTVLENKQFNVPIQQFFAVLNSLRRESQETTRAVLGQFLNTLKNEIPPQSLSVYLRTLAEKLNFGARNILKQHDIWIDFLNKQPDAMAVVTNLGFEFEFIQDLWSSLQTHANAKQLIPQFINQVTNYTLQQFDLINFLNSTAVKILSNFIDNPKWHSSFLSLPPEQLALFVKLSDVVSKPTSERELQNFSSKLQQFILGNASIFFNENVLQHLPAPPDWAYQLVRFDWATAASGLSADQIKMLVTHPTLQKFYNFIAFDDASMISLTDIADLKWNFIEKIRPVLQTQVPHKIIDKEIVKYISDTIKAYYAARPGISGVSPLISDTLRQYPPTIKNEIILQTAHLVLQNTAILARTDWLTSFCAFLRDLINPQSTTEETLLWRHLLDNYPLLWKPALQSLWSTIDLTVAYRQQLFSDPWWQEKINAFFLQKIQTVTQIDELVDVLQFFDWSDTAFKDEWAKAKTQWHQLLPYFTKPINTLSEEQLRQSNITISQWTSKVFQQIFTQLNTLRQGQFKQVPIAMQPPQELQATILTRLQKIAQNNHLALIQWIYQLPDSYFQVVFEPFRPVQGGFAELQNKKQLLLYFIHQHLFHVPPNEQSELWTWLSQPAQSELLQSVMDISVFNFRHPNLFIDLNTDLPRTDNTLLQYLSNAVWHFKIYDTTTKKIQLSHLSNAQLHFFIDLITHLSFEDLKKWPLTQDAGGFAIDISKDVLFKEFIKPLIERYAQQNNLTLNQFFEEYPIMELFYKIANLNEQEINLSDAQILINKLHPKTARELFLIFNFLGYYKLLFEHQMAFKTINNIQPIATFDDILKTQIDDAIKKRIVMDFFDKTNKLIQWCIDKKWQNVDDFLKTEFIWAFTPAMRVHSSDTMGANTIFQAQWQLVTQLVSAFDDASLRQDLLQNYQKTFTNLLLSAPLILSRVYYLWAAEYLKQDIPVDFFAKVTDILAYRSFDNKDTSINLSYEFAEDLNNFLRTFPVTEVFIQNLQPLIALNQPIQFDGHLFQHYLNSVDFLIEHFYTIINPIISTVSQKITPSIQLINTDNLDLTFLNIFIDPVKGMEFFNAIDNWEAIEKTIIANNNNFLQKLQHLNSIPNNELISHISLLNVFYISYTQIANQHKLKNLLTSFGQSIITNFDTLTNTILSNLKTTLQSLLQISAQQRPSLEALKTYLIWNDWLFNIPNFLKNIINISHTSQIFTSTNFLNVILENCKLFYTFNKDILQKFYGIKLLTDTLDKSKLLPRDAAQIATSQKLDYERVVLKSLFSKLSILNNYTQIRSALFTNEHLKQEVLKIEQDWLNNFILVMQKSYLTEFNEQIFTHPLSKHCMRLISLHPECYNQIMINLTSNLPKTQSHLLPQHWFLIKLFLTIIRSDNLHVQIRDILLNNLRHLQATAKVFYLDAEKTAALPIFPNIIARFCEHWPNYKLFQNIISTQPFNISRSITRAKLLQLIISSFLNDTIGVLSADNKEAHQHQNKILAMWDLTDAQNFIHQRWFVSTASSWAVFQSPTDESSRYVSNFDTNLNTHHLMSAMQQAIFQSNAQKFANLKKHIQSLKYLELARLPFQFQMELETVATKLKRLESEFPQEGMNWALFKKQFKQYEHIQPLKQFFQQQPKQHVTKEALQNFIKSLPNNYINIPITYTNWTGMQRFSKHDNLVLQLHFPAEILSEVATNATEKKIIEQILASASKLDKDYQIKSLHPVLPSVLGWVRIAIPLPNFWVIEEIQSDLLRDIKRWTQAVQSRYLDNPALHAAIPGIASKLIKKLQFFQQAALQAAVKAAQDQPNVTHIGLHGLNTRLMLSFNTMYPKQGVPQSFKEIYVELPKSLNWQEMPIFQWIKTFVKPRHVKSVKKAISNKFLTDDMTIWVHELKKPITTSPESATDQKNQPNTSQKDSDSDNE